MVSLAATGLGGVLREAHWGFWALIGAGVMAFGLVLMPFYAGSMAVGGTVVMCLAVASYRWPVATVQATFPLLIIANTRFRHRDEFATLAGEIDLQVVLELGLYGAAFMVACVVLFSKVVPRFRLSVAERLLAGFSLFALSSTMWSPLPTLTMVRSVQLCIMVFFVIVAVRLLGPLKAIGTLFFSLITSIFVFSLAALTIPGAEGFQSPNAPDAAFERFSWFAMHPIPVAGYVYMGLLFLLSCSAIFSVRSKPWARIIRAVVVVALVAVGIATESRGPAIAFVAAVGAFFLLRAARPWVIAVAAPGAVALVLLVIAGFPLVAKAFQSGESSQGAVANFMYRGQNLEGVLSLNGRVDLWLDAVPLFVSNPITGIGYVGSRAVLLELRGWSANAHNALVQSLLDLGLVGTLLLWGAIATMFVGRILAGPGRSPSRDLQRFVFTLGVFLVINSVATESFAGVPTIDSLITFTALVGASGMRRGRI